MISRLIALSSLLAVVVMLVMMNLTNPVEVGPLGVLVFFTMFYIAMFGLATWLVDMFLKVVKKTSHKRLSYAAVIAFGPIMLLLLRSFGSLNLGTLGVVILFCFLGCFLVNKRL